MFILTELLLPKRFWAYPHSKKFNLSTIYLSCLQSGDHEPMIAENTPRRPRSFSESLYVFTSPSMLVGAMSPTRVGKVFINSYNSVGIFLKERAKWEIWHICKLIYLMVGNHLLRTTFIGEHIFFISTILSMLGYSTCPGVGVSDLTTSG